MKNFALLFIITTNVFSLNCLAQNGNSSPSNLKIENALVKDKENSNDLAVVSYKVEERINVTLGSNITTYEVSNIDLVNTNDLGGNNVRIVTPKYAKAKVEAVTDANEPPKATVTSANPVKPAKLPSASAIAIKERTVNIDIADTYERVLDKGYKSIDMLKSVGNSRFFDGDLITAAKWYTQLFTLTTDLEAVYYYRYAESLKAIGELEKSKEMMAIFESKNQ